MIICGIMVPLFLTHAQRFSHARLIEFVHEKARFLCAGHLTVDGFGGFKGANKQYNNHKNHQLLIWI
jgi:hypothetical protein